MDSLVFDERGALERVAGDRALLRDLVRMALEFYRGSDVGLTQRPHASRDVVFHTAHRLKGSFGNVGAMRVATCAARLCQTVIEGRDSAPIIAELAADIAEFEAAYRRYDSSW